METLEQEFADLRNWKDEVKRICGIFRIASGQSAEVLVLHPATWALIRQLASQSSRSGQPVPFPDSPAGLEDVINLGTDSSLRLDLRGNVPLSSFQVAVNSRVHS